MNEATYHPTVTAALHALFTRMVRKYTSAQDMKLQQTLVMFGEIEEHMCKITTKPNFENDLSSAY